MRARIRRRALRILGASDSTNAELSVLLTDDDQVRELNQTYREQDRTTDVLSFALEDIDAQGESAEHAGWGACEGMPRLLGDVVISVEQAQRQAPDGDLGAELTRLLVHGFCHLQGLVHGTEPERRRMQQAETRLLDLFRLGRGLTARAMAGETPEESPAP